MWIAVQVKQLRCMSNIVEPSNGSNGSNHRTSGSIGIWPAEPERNPPLAVTSSGFEVQGALEILGSDEQHHEAWDMDDQMIRASAKTPIANQVHQVKRQAMA